MCVLTVILTKENNFTVHDQLNCAHWYIINCAHFIKYGISKFCLQVQHHFRRSLICLGILTKINILPHDMCSYRHPSFSLLQLFRLYRYPGVNVKKYWGVESCTNVATFYNIFFSPPSRLCPLTRASDP